MRSPSLIALFAALLASPALAEDATPVMVSSFQARNEDSAALAALIEGFVAQKLGDRTELIVLRIEDAPDFEDYSARIYMESCPSGEIVGCSFVIADRAGARWAVTGTVQALVRGTRVDIDVVDVRGARVAVSFRSELESGRDEAFAEGVARVLVAAIAGEVGREQDIRPEGVEDTDPEDDAAVAAELAALSAELGEFTTTIRRTNTAIRPPKLTEEDILEREEEEGSKPWERLGMSSGDYLRYKNSGLDLPTWRKRAEGRRWQLLVRAGGGYINGPVDGSYYARSALDASTLLPVDVYTAQSVESGASYTGLVAVGLGVHPMLDLSVEGGVTGGSFDYYFQTETVGEVAQNPQEGVRQNSNAYLSAKATVGFFPARSIRPTFGGGLTWFRGSGIGDHYTDLADEWAVFPAQSLWLVDVFGGGEARLSDSLDVFLQVPVHFLVGGERVLVEKTTTVATLEGINPPEGAAAIGVSAVAGIQVRLFGAKLRETSILDRTDEM